MYQDKQKRLNVIFFFILIAAEAALIVLFASGQNDVSRSLVSELYVAGIVICAILLVFLLFTRLWPAMLLKDARKRLTSIKADSDSAGFDPDGFRDKLLTALQNDGFVISDAEIKQSDGEMLRVVSAASKVFSLFYDRMYRYVIFTSDFRKARDFDMLARYAKSLIEAEGLTEEQQARSGFCTAVVLLMAHVPEQMQAACREEAVVDGPAYVPVACDISTGKAYYLSGNALALLEFRCAQRIIKKYVASAPKK